MALVSVILPVHNGEKWIERAVTSIQNQTFPEWELIIIDDGSKDDSLLICKRLSEDDSRIKVFSNPVNLGIYGTLNRLIDLSSGDFIAIQEQDDLSLPDRLEKEIHLLQAKHEIGLVSGIAEWLDDDGTATGKFPGILAHGGQFPQDKTEMIRYLYIEQTKVVNAGCMFRRSILEELPVPFDQNAKMAGDLQFFIHLAHKYLIWGIPEVLVRMNRGGKHKHVTSNKELQFFESHRCIRKLYDEYKDDPSSPINRQLYRQSMSYELNLEGRYYGGFKGMRRILTAIIYYPKNKRAWRSLGELFYRAVRKTFKDANDN